MHGKMPGGFEPLFVFCLAALVALSCTAAVAQPRTMYKPRDIENARHNIERYEWARAIVRGWESRAAFAMQQDREFFEELIPELTPGCHHGQNCPACADPVPKRGICCNTMSWSPEDLHRLTCRVCGTAFPNDEYPETGVLELPRMGQTLTYYQTPGERALPPDATDEERAAHALPGLGNSPAMTSMSALNRWFRTNWAWRQALLLGKLYAVTGEVAYAQRTLWILDRFARVFPNYLYKNYYGGWADWPPAQVAASFGDPATPRGGRFPPGVVRHPYGLLRLHVGRDDEGEYSTLFNGFWGSGRISPHGSSSDAGPLLDMTIAYDLTRDARYPDGAPVYDEQTQRRIVADLIDAGCTDYDHWDDLSNKGVATRSLSAAVGLLLEQPERVRRGLEGFNELLASRYHFDGFYSESPNYAEHNYHNVRELPDLLYGYSDPPAYRAEDGARLDNLNPFAVGHFSLAWLSMVRMPAPGNLMPVIGNTYYTYYPSDRVRTVSPVYAETLAARLGGPHAGLLEAVTGRPLSEWGSEYSLWYRDPDLQADGPTELPLRSEWFPGWHVGVLRGGDAQNTALYLVGDEHRWTIHSGHRHRDLLNLSYYAFGEEMVSDRGYFSGSGELTPDGRGGQRWTSGTLSHNLVVVDERDQSGAPTGSNLELFGVAPGVEMLQLSGFGGYEQCEEYRRTCAHIQTPEGGHYIVDFFRVKGGRIHQYSFHCNGSLVDIRPAQPAPEPTELSDAWSLWVERPRAITPREPSTFTWRHNEVNLDLMLLNSNDTVQRIVIMDAPGWRCARVTNDFDNPPIQQILAENRAGEDEDSLATRYAAVVVPYITEASPVLSARLLEDDPVSGAMAVEVRFAGRTDYIISARDQQQRQYGPVTAAGEFAFVSVDDAGRVTRAYLLAGTRLECGETVVELAEPTTTLRVASVSDRTFHLAEPLPPGVAETGWYVLADGPHPLQEGYPRPQTGFEMEATTDHSITVRDYPVLECDEVTILHAAWLQAGD